MKLRGENLAASYDGRGIFEDVSFEVEQGTFLSVLGPSGCGKSTLLNVLSGILTADRGQVYLDDSPVTGISPHFSYMPQDDLLMPWLSILDNVCLYGSIHGGKKELREKAMAYMPEFGLAGYEHRYPETLSGGMRQRAAFLRTALCPAEVMLLDEPFASLDVITRGSMQDWLSAMRQTLGRTTLLVTHDIDEAIYLSDSILILNRLSGRPAGIRKRIEIAQKKRSREWLFAQTELRQEIYRLLMEESHEDH